MLCRWKQCLENRGKLEALLSLFLFFFLRFYLFISRERKRNINVQSPLVRPLPETWPTTQACSLTGNRTGDSEVHRPALSPLSHTSQGSLSFFNWKKLVHMQTEKKSPAKRERCYLLLSYFTKHNMPSIYGPSMLPLHDSAGPICHQFKDQ